MSQHVRMEQIQFIIYIEFLYLGESLPLTVYLFLPITYENQKNKNTSLITKSSVQLPMLPAMHTQTNLDQGLLQVPPFPPLSSPSHPKRQSCQ